MTQPQFPTRNSLQSSAQPVLNQTTGKKHTLKDWHWTTEWNGTCPVCNVTYQQSEVPCVVCGKRALAYWREQHAHQPYENAKTTRWIECYLKCSHCHAMYKSAPCPREDGAIPLSKINVSLPIMIKGPRRLVIQTVVFFLVMMLGYLLTFFISPGASALVLFGFVGVGAFAAECAAEMWPKPQRWHCYSD